MFNTFAVDERQINTLDAWVAYLREIPAKERATLMDRLRLFRHDPVPVFSKSGSGQTLIEWARSNKSSHTLYQEIALLK